MEAILDFVLNEGEDTSKRLFFEVPSLELIPLAQVDISPLGW